MTGTAYTPNRTTARAGQAAEGDYLVEFLRHFVRALTSVRTRTACTGILILLTVFATLGIAGGVENGFLSVYCLLPLAGIFGLVALFIHLGRQ